MKKIVLISCCKSKLPATARARDLYISPLFKYSLQYAESLNPDNIFILSAEYHLLELERWIDPYDTVLRSFTAEEKREWGNRVATQLSERTNLDRDNFIVLAGQEYIKPIQEYIASITNTLEGLRYGERLKFLRSQLGLL